MNIFFTLLFDYTSFELIKKLINRYQPDTCYINYSGYHFGGTLPYFDNIETDIYYYTYDNCRNANYTEYVFYDNCPPIDTALLTDMAEDEPTILKMMDRLTSTQKSLSYEERKSIYHRNLRYWNYMLDAAEINVAVFTNTPHDVYDYIIYCLCKKKGIATGFTYLTTLRPYGYFMHDIKIQNTEILTIYQHFADKYRNTPIEEIELPQDFDELFEKMCGANSSKTPMYMLQKSNRRFTEKKRIFSALIKRVIAFPKNLRKYGAGHLRTVLLGILDNNRSFIKEYDKLCVPADFSKPYIYLPLHYQPELSTCPLGGFFVHQQLIAQMISFYLPDGAEIYIKEHPMQTGRCREITVNHSLYRDLAAIPNVRLVPRSTDTYELLEHCVAVASCTGTAGFEGMCMGKPHLVFGYYIYMYAPGTFIIRSNEDCKNALDYIFTYGAKHTLKDMKIFVKALSEVCSKCYAFNLLGWEIPEGSPDSTLLDEGLAKVIDEQLEKQNGCNQDRY